MGKKICYLEKLKKALQNYCLDTTDYYLPAIWNTLDYPYILGSDRKKEIKVDPVPFYSYYLDRILQVQMNPKTECDVIYCIEIRSFTAWNHTRDTIQSGTFLKALLLLPQIKRMGINTIYLLPIFCSGSCYKKGNRGSCYSIKNIYELREELHDELLGKYNKEILDIQFGAFVEACHRYGIHVMLDFVFRTQSRDSDLIFEHPDWFYWIDKKCDEKFAPIEFAGIPKLQSITKEYVEIMYRENLDKIKKYLTMFRESPDKIDMGKWEALKEQVKGGDNLLKLIEEQFGITTAPAFSDVLNDFQDMWRDVTYVKLSFDQNETAKRYLGGNYAPYIMQDVAKASVCCGMEKNVELFKYILGVIPYYQQKFGLDGARIDMGHAIPNELNEEIIQNCKRGNKHFILWSEENDVEKSRFVKMNGFHFISGFLWQDFRRYKELGFLKPIMDKISRSKLPILAQIDNSDGYRAAYLYEPEVEKQLLTLCFVLTNVKVMLTAGFEVEEKGPLNIGFEEDCKVEKILDKNDPMNGCLALFDLYRIHWINPQPMNWIAIIQTLSDIRQKIRKANVSVKFKEKKLNNVMVVEFFYGVGKVHSILYFPNATVTYENLKEYIESNNEKLSISYLNKQGELCEILGKTDIPKEERVYIVEKTNKERRV